MAKTPATADPQELLPLSPAVLSVLLALAEGERHGYGIMKAVAEAEGGALTMGPGTLYGSLDRMVHAGLVEETGTTDNERRRYYRLTRFGGKVLAAEVARLEAMVKTARRLRLDGRHV